MLRFLTVAQVFAGGYFAWLAYEKHDGWLLGFTAIAALNFVDGVRLIRRRRRAEE